MLLKDVITLAKFGELSGIAIKDNVEAIVAFINLGMLELYKRFPLKAEEYVITLEDGVMYYDMPSDFMYYLNIYREKDKDKPWEDNEVPVNSEDEVGSVFLPDWNTLQVPSDVLGSYLSVIYVAKPKPVTVDMSQDSEYELDLPDTLISALLSFIRYKAYLGVKASDESSSMANLARFERECENAKVRGISAPAETMSMNDRLRDRGFA